MKKQVEKETVYEERLLEFIKEHGYIPKVFNSYNKTDCKEYVPCLATNCGYPSGKSSVLVISIVEDDG